MPCHTIPYNTIQYHTIPYQVNTIPSTIPYRTIPNHAAYPIPYHLPYHLACHNIYHAMPYHTMDVLPSTQPVATFDSSFIVSSFDVACTCCVPVDCHLPSTIYHLPSTIPGCLPVGPNSVAARLLTMTTSELFLPVYATGGVRWVRASQQSVSVGPAWGSA